MNNSYTWEFRRDMVERYRAAPNRTAFAAKVGVACTTLNQWHRSPALTEDPKEHQARVRTHEFRMVGEALQVISATGEWEPYVPFREVRQRLAGLIEEAHQRRRYEKQLPSPNQHGGEQARRQLMRRAYGNKRYLATRNDPERWAIYLAQMRERRWRKRHPNAPMQPTAGEP